MTANQDDGGGSRRSLIILGCVVALLIGSVGYSWWSSRKDHIDIPHGKVSDFLVTWECMSCSNRLEDRAGPGPHKCPQCGKDEMYVVINWACPEHGGQSVVFQYDDQGQPSKVRIAKGDWTPALTPEGGWNIKCPTCGRVMMPADAVKRAPNESRPPA